MALDDATFLVSLSQMLDLALGTPEVGSVNFNILHNFLHILLRRTSLNNAKAEYHGDDAVRMKTMVASLKDSSNFNLHESDISNKDENIKQEDHVPDEIVFIANFSTLDEQSPQKQGDEANEIYQMNRSQLAGHDSPITAEQTFSSRVQDNSEQQNDEEENNEKEVQFHDPSNDVDPSNDKIPIAEQIDNIKSSTNASKISGLTTASLTASKTSKKFSQNLDCGEQLNGLKEEVASLRNDMARMIEDYAEMRYRVDQLLVDKEEIVAKIAKKEAVIGDIVDVIEMKLIGNASSDVPQTGDEQELFTGEVDTLSIESLSNSEILVEDQSEYSDSRKSNKKPVSTASTLSKPDKDLINDVKTLKDSKDEKTSLNVMMEKFKNGNEDNFKKIDARIKILEKMLNFDQFEGFEGMKDVIQNIKSIEIDLERMNWIIENLNKEKETRDKYMDVISILEHTSTFSSHRADLETDCCKFDVVLTLKGQNRILTEQVELLKIVKTDKEDLENALASKADAIVVNKKVSYNRFDFAYHELTRALEDTILKSNQQETVLKETLDTVQQKIDDKLDKTEGFSIQEYMEEKLQALQDKFKELTRKKHESEAAAAKKILTGIQCITCDKNVIMKREQNALNYPDPMPYRKNIKPYLTYKLDQARKHQRQFPAKHINLFTAAIQEMDRHKFSTDNIAENSSRDHFSNRYCGGSHTITTPQQRVMRMGHFLTDWGPEIIQLNEGMVRGTDEQLYHGRPMPPGTTNVPKVCGLDENMCCNISEKSENFKE